MRSLRITLRPFVLLALAVLALGSESPVPRLELIDVATGTAPAAYRPGMHLQGRLHAARGVTLGDISTTEMSIQFMVKDPSGSGYTRTVTWKADGKTYDPSATVFTFDVLVHPATFTPASDSAREALVTMADAIGSALGAGPGTYTGVVRMDRRGCEDVKVPVALTTAADVTAMRALIAGLPTMPLAGAADRAAAQKAADEAQKAADRAASCRLSLTDADAAAGNEPASVHPAQAIDVFFDPPKGKNFLSALGHGPKTTLLVKLVVPDVSAIADLTLRIPEDFDPASDKAARFMLFRDPRTVKAADMWSDVHVFRTVLGFIKRPGLYQAELTADIGGRILARLPFAIDLRQPPAFADFQALTAAWRTVDMGNAYMENPGLQDAALVQEITGLIAARYEKPLRVIITSDDWIIERHPLTGIILNRQVYVQYAYRSAQDNTHYVESASIIAERIGNDWGTIRVNAFAVTPAFPIAEANIHAKRP